MNLLREMEQEVITTLCVVRRLIFKCGKRNYYVHVDGHLIEDMYSTVTNLFVRVVSQYGIFQFNHVFFSFFCEGERDTTIHYPRFA